MFQPIKLAIAAGIAISGLTAVAAAHDSSRIRIASVKVDYTDLDLRQEEDARIMLERIERAAYQACGGNERFHPAYRYSPRRTTGVFRECREDAISRAVAQVNAQALWLAFRVE